MNETTLRNKIVKNALLKKYNFKDVAVKGGTGTAYGWVEVKITLDKPSNCICIYETKLATWAKPQYEYTYRQGFVNNFGDRKSFCPSCSTILKANQEKVDKIVYGCGAEFSHYYADDGYNTERAEVLTQLDIRV